MQLHRQVRVVGTVERLDAAASDAYFAARPRESQLGAWACRSRRCSPIGSRSTTASLVHGDLRRGVEDVPRPVYWGGYRLRPEIIDFWQGRRSRLHDRLRYRRSCGSQPSWLIERLAP